MPAEKDPSYALQAYASAPHALYSVDVAALLSRMPRHLVLVCCRRGLVTPRIDPEFGGFSFDDEAIRQLQRIEYLRSECGINFTGIQIIVQLMAKVEELKQSEHAGRRRG